MLAETWASFRVPRKWKKILESVCEELQLLKVLVFPLSGEFSMNYFYTHSATSECKTSRLLITVQGL
jgi:hypothetical protein